ncbi:hypothetical protein HHK36_013052 [Tetracentron sinense]|uniref:Uncharacterized protein n=1 Tax=Tetracentron sinense TaxID=13715 RepID=A0A834ZAF9_TETSI|nr:hypothetical protein HHK36_013052 [Tetracentron sinense]
MVDRDKGAEEGGDCGSELAVVSSSSACHGSPLPLREAPPSYHPYPPPLAKYEDVLSNPKVFMVTLQKLHATMATKFMIPIVGGKELDLHRLFVEVTSRGGIEKVIRERRWKEVTAIFSFPSTATNASFVLRKYYVQLLHHYEQLYFFGARGCNYPPTASWQSPSPTPVSTQGLVEPVLPSPEVQAATTQKRRKSTGEFFPGASPSSSVGSPVIGVIDGKFESGYLVTVTVGTEKLRGVLYHSPEYPPSQVPQYSGIVGNNSTKDPAAMGVQRRRRRKKSEMRKRDPAHPKPNRSGYNFFFAEQHARLKLLHPEKDREISKMIGNLWNNLTETQKAVYQEQGVKDKERYKSEMEVYRERLKTGQIISNAMPIQQRPFPPEVMVEVYAKIETEEGNISGKSDSEGEKTAGEDSEMETSPVAGNAAE